MVSEDIDVGDFVDNFVVVVVVGVVIIVVVIVIIVMVAYIWQFFTGLK